MPYISYKDMQLTTTNNSNAKTSGYFSPNPEYKEDDNVYRGYHTYDSFGLQMQHIMEFDEDGKVTRENAV